MATATPDIDEIRRKMAQIRRELHEDVRGVVEGAEAATDWRRYVRSYPWLSVGLAFAVGYLVIPRRHRATTTIHVAPSVSDTSTPPEPVRLAAEPEKKNEKKKGRSLLGVAFGLVAPMAWKAAQGYALQFAEQWLAQKMAEQLQGHPNLGPAFGIPPEPPRGPAARPPSAPRF